VAIPNRLDLTDERLLGNLRQVQRQNGLPEDEDLGRLSGAAAGEGGAEQVVFPNFSVEMETGTGKTYIYIRTALELFRRYGFRKFIIVVPSIAIREGVLKTFEMTRKHFAGLYENTPYHFCQYDSANLSQVRQFALSESLEFMVMTLAAFNKASNVIRQSTDRLQGETPINLVQATRPVLILDEP
jgi:type III restriction enzyme